MQLDEATLTFNADPELVKTLANFLIILNFIGL